MTGKNKNDKDIEKQNEKLEEILHKLTSLETQISDLKSENKSLKDTLTEIKEDNRGLIKRVISLEKHDNEKEKEMLALKNRLSSMEETVDNYEQYSKLDNVIISGLRVFRPYNATALLTNEQNQPELDDEGKEQWAAKDKEIMMNNLIQFAKDKLNFELKSHDIIDIHTLPRGEGKVDTCIVRFANRIAREKVMRNKFRLKTTSQHSKKIYINEHLTKKNSEIARAARLMKKDGKILGTWTKNCRIMIKKLDERVIKVQNMGELERAVKTP